MSKHQKLLDWIEGELIAQRLHLGDVLPDDRELARLTNMSQNHVREGLKHCEEVGLVRLYEGKRKTILAELLREPAVSAGPAIGLSLASSTTPHRDLFQACLLLESQALVTDPPNRKAYPELDRLLEQMGAPETTLSDFHDLEADFHIQLGQLSGNPLISALLATMRDAMVQARFELAARLPLWSSTAARLRMEYRAIVDAVRSGDPALARTLLTASMTDRFSEAGVELNLEDWGQQEADQNTILSPVEMEDRELVPDHWSGPIDPQLFDALQNIQPILPPQTATGSEGEPSGGQTQPTKPAAAPEATGREQGQPVEDPKTPEAPRQPAPAPVATAPAPTGSATRKRRGKVSPVVRATVLPPRPSIPAEGEEAARARQPEAGLTDREAAELNKIEQAQAQVKARLARAAQQRELAAREAREREQAQQEAEAREQLEAKLKTEEERLAALETELPAPTGQEEPEEPKAGRLGSPHKRRFALMNYLGFRQQRDPAPAGQEPDGQGTGEALDLPDGYERVEEPPAGESEGSPEQVREQKPPATQPAPESDEPADSAAEGSPSRPTGEEAPSQEGKARQGSGPLQKKKGKRKKR